MSPRSATARAPAPERAPDLTAAIEPWAAPIVVRHIADDVVDRLVTAVGLGVYIAGQQLPTERELAAMLGVSRTSIRDALKQLTQSGYLAVRRGRKGGYFVLADWGPESAEHVRRHLVAHWSEFEHIFDARTLVEPLIARTAAARRTPDDIEVLRAAVQAYIDAPNRNASRLADTALHLAVAEATHNPQLVAISTDLRAKITLNLGAEPYSDEARHTAIGQHAELVTAIAEGRGDDAAAIAAQHFTISENLIRKLVDRAEHDEPRGRK